MEDALAHEQKGWVGARFARLSTGLKMLLILSAGLFPLGLIAILASVQSSRENSAERAAETHASLQLSAQRINSAIARAALTIRSASAAVALSGPDSGVCVSTLERLARAQPSPGRFALYGAGNELRCATAGYAPPPVLANPNRLRSQVALSKNGEALRFALFDSQGMLEGTGEFSRASLAMLTADTPGAFDLELIQGDRRMLLRDDYAGGPLVRTQQMSAPVASRRIELRISAGAVPISAAELLMILLPVMMWIAAAAIGWYIVDRLLLRPLVRMQKAVSAYRPGDRHIDMPTLSSPAREIGALGLAFDQVTRTVARHESDLEAAVERQTRLVREVHHRVKNNLQVVASLLNLHSRGSRNEDVAAAYASIQRRVDALAVVHRNHYAELEENRGVALKPLISELAANLRATAPRSAAGMTIRIDIAPCHASQDVAVSVAFLITEVVEFAMFCGGSGVTISLRPTEAGAARLAIETDSLKADVPCDPMLTERFDRIVTGLSRQLRSTLTRDVDRGRYSLTIAVLGSSPE